MIIPRYQKICTSSNCPELIATIQMKLAYDLGLVLYPTKLLASHNRGKGKTTCLGISDYLLGRAQVHGERASEKRGRGEVNSKARKHHVHMHPSY